MSFGEILLMMFSAVLVENFIFSKFYGCCPFLGVSEHPDTALGMGMAVTFVMTVSGAATWLVYQYLLLPFHLEYLKTVAFILVIAALVQFIEMFLRRFLPALYSALGIYLPLITTNCAVMGACLINIKEEYTFMQTLVSSFSYAVGFGLALVLFAGVRERILLARVPKPLQDTSIGLVTAGMLALVFFSFKGMV